MTALPDVNVLVALFDASHVNHDSAHDWFGGDGKLSWATCPLTENGCVRVLSNPAYASIQASPREVISRLAQLCGETGHDFWPDDVFLLRALDGPLLSRLQGPHQLTDFYLAALAKTHQGTLFTFDGSLGRVLQGSSLESALVILR